MDGAPHSAEPGAGTPQVFLLGLGMCARLGICFLQNEDIHIYTDIHTYTQTYIHTCT